MQQIAHVRRFNRTVVSQIGALNAKFLGSNRSLAACRVIFEVGLGGIEIRELRERMNLDSGYASRLLRSLEAEKLITVTKVKADRRASRVRLTPAGRKELALLNRLSDDAAAKLLEPLSDVQREELMAAMASVERLLLASAVRTRVESPASPLARACLAEYFGELQARFEQGFDAAHGLAGLVESMTPPAGYFVVAMLEGRAVGCGGLQCHAGHGMIKRMWVSPDHRRLGVGKRILQHLESLAREHGLPRVRLDTNRALHEARAMYHRCGYREVEAFNSERYAHHWFEKDL